MKCVNKISIVFIMFLSIWLGIAQPVLAEEDGDIIISGDWKYSVLQGGTAQIEDYLGDAVELNVPDELDGYQVTNIGRYGFDDCEFEKIVLPVSLEVIDDYAFSGCSNLKEIEIPDSVTIIGDRGFTKCTGLTKIKLPEGLAETGYGLFSNCTSLKTVHLPGSLAEIEFELFKYCTGLEEVILSEGIQIIGQRAFLGCENLETVVLPESLTKISERAFEECVSLKTITIPGGLKTIETYAFGYCDNLQTIILSKNFQNIKLINKYTFPLYDSLKNIYVEEGQKYYSSVNGILFSKDLTKLYIYPYARASKSYTVPQGTKTIVTNAFDSNEYLTTIKLADSVKKIETNAIVECANLDNISIGKNTESIKAHAFSRCFALKKIIVNGQNKYYKSKDGVLFNKSMTTLVYYPLGKKQTEYKIPDTVQTIGEAAFYRCNGLKKITLPTKLKVIKDEAFSECDGLSEIKIGNYVTDIGKYAFGYCNNIKKITLGIRVKNLGEGAFYLCSVDTLKLPSSINSIGDYAFIKKFNIEEEDNDWDEEEEVFEPYENNPVYMKIHYAGTMEMWKQEFSKLKGYKDISYKICSNGKTGHQYKELKTKATFSRAGRKELKCTKCGDVRKTYATWAKLGSVKISYTVYTYNGKVKTPTVTVKNANGTKLKNGTDYTVTYSKGRKNVGKYTVTVKFKNKYLGTVKKTFTIKPRTTSITKLTKGTKSFTVKWSKKNTQTSGYQICYGTSTNRDNNKKVLVKSNKTTSKKITGLKKNKKYYIWVRTYKTVNGTKYYSDWSSRKYVITK